MIPHSKQFADTRSHDRQPPETRRLFCRRGTCRVETYEAAPQEQRAIPRKQCNEIASRVLEWEVSVWLAGRALGDLRKQQGERSPCHSAGLEHTNHRHAFRSIPTLRDQILNANRSYWDSGEVRNSPLARIPLRKERLDRKNRKDALRALSFILGLRERNRSLWWAETWGPIWSYSNTR